ncbi:hypothetical protein BaRGS_00021674, partial [Batillaria attramentaria]
ESLAVKARRRSGLILSCLNNGDAVFRLHSDVSSSAVFPSRGLGWERAAGWEPSPCGFLALTLEAAGKQKHGHVGGRSFGQIEVEDVFFLACLCSPRGERVNGVWDDWDRGEISYDLTRLLDFLSRSARGALAMNDFRRQQFVLVNGALKLSDVDDAGFDEPACSTDDQCVLHFSSANFTKRLKCQEGRCRGYNEYRNMFNAGRHFTTFLLPHGAPPGLRPLIDHVVSVYENCSLTTKELVSRMDKIVQLYKTGRYLNRTLPEDFATSFKEVPSSDLPGQFDYRCRMSMSGAGCTLSVFDQREAEDLCDADPDCRGVIMTQQKTWAGALMNDV